MVERVPCGFEPRWTSEDPRQAYEAFSRKFVAKNLWRVAPEFDFEDLMQEAYVVFLVVQRRYPQVVDAKHFMALFHTSLRNHVHKLATKRTQRPDHVLDDAEARIFAIETDDFIGEMEVQMLLEDAPIPVRAYVERLLEAEERPQYEVKDGVRETSRQFMARIAEVPEFVNVPEMLRKWAYGVRGSVI